MATYGCEILNNDPLGAGASLVLFDAIPTVASTGHMWVPTAINSDLDDVQVCEILDIKTLNTPNPYMEPKLRESQRGVAPPIMQSALVDSHTGSKLTDISNYRPIYPVFREFDNIRAAYTGKGTSAKNRYFSFSRSKTLEESEGTRVVIENIEHFAQICDFNAARVTWPNGTWPHTGKAIIAEEYTWIPHPLIRGIVPVSHENQPITYDGIATRSQAYVLGAQGADCPTVFLYDPVAKVIGLAHAGWKPAVRGVIGNTINAMVALSAQARDIIAYISPGVGDRYNEFMWDEAMEPHIRDVFTLAGREELLTDMSIRHELTNDDRSELRKALGRDSTATQLFKLSDFIATELKRYAVPVRNITLNLHSTIVDRYDEEVENTPLFRYHSFRRDRGLDPERPGHGLSMAIIFISSVNS